ncbi:hypothetical protein GCM10007857_69790 [Bradyrhizobium iriomotense]|uniref:Uncharacterized protein n=1 Tax=Bradyrhizobium iriomotense TaxID=441950 RepID=A0ABQ6BBF3_9BRAD|nr:hypothetical protein GCM10007857_69790 [Bradyrhizobium iriomotense]
MLPTPQAARSAKATAIPYSLWMEVKRNGANDAVNNRKPLINPTRFPYPSRPNTDSGRIPRQMLFRPELNPSKTVKIVAPRTEREDSSTTIVAAESRMDERMVS